MNDASKAHDWQLLSRCVFPPPAGKRALRKINRFSTLGAVMRFIELIRKYFDFLAAFRTRAGK